MGLLAGIIMPADAQSGTNGSPGSQHLQSLKFTAAPTDDGSAYPVDFTYSVALGHEPGVTRRDPSDVIKEGEKYYLWYSKVTKGPDVFQYPSGYSADVWYATSPDGHQWTEQGKAIGKGGKGRMKGKGPGETKMGMAFADSATGPFMKQGGALHAGHEVMVWPQGKGIASLATASGPRVVYYAADGVHFEPRNAVRTSPAAPGAWRSDDFKNNPEGEGLEKQRARPELFGMLFTGAWRLGKNPNNRQVK